MADLTLIHSVFLLEIQVHVEIKFKQIDQTLIYRFNVEFEHFFDIRRQLGHQ